MTIKQELKKIIIDLLDELYEARRIPVEDMATHNVVIRANKLLAKLEKKEGKQ